MPPTTSPHSNVDTDSEMGNYFDDSAGDAQIPIDDTTDQGIDVLGFHIPMHDKPRLIIFIAAASILLVSFISISFCILLTSFITHLKYNVTFKEDSLAEFRVRGENVMGHLRKLNDIGLSFPGHGRTARGGYNASATYVESTLGVNPDQLAEENDSYFVYRRQYFNTWDYTVNETSILLQVNGQHLTFDEDFKLLHFAGSSPTDEHGLHVQNIVRVVFIPEHGCEQQDFDQAKEPFFGGDSLFVVKRGICDFKTKAEFSFANGANAVVIYNEGNSPDRMDVFSGTLGGKVNNGVGPVYAVSYKTAQDWKKLQEQQVSLEINLFLQSEITSIPTFNLIFDVASTYVESRTNTLPTVVIGSHLDGVSAGAGVNDNGSGAMSTLEIARMFRTRSIRAKNHVRFCFWAAEENGLVGSEWYVTHISEQERKNIALNLNFDMLGSPNYIRGIYEAQTSPIEAMIAPSQRIQQLFESYFQKHKISYKYVPFNGRSDYGPFLDAGIPAGGLDTGAEVLKTAEERKMFGGIANAAYDPCYHQSCDTIDNINPQAIEEMSNAAGTVLLELANMEKLAVYLHE